MQSGKEESWEVFLLPEMALRSLKTARGSERGDRLEQVACQVADLALEMTEDALREASMYLRRCDSDRACHGAGPPSFPNCRFRFLGPPGFGGERPRRPKGIEALAASTKNREEEWAAWWMLSASKSRDEGAQQYKIGKYPNWFFL